MGGDQPEYPGYSNGMFLRLRIQGILPEKTCLLKQMTEDLIG